MAFYSLGGETNSQHTKRICVISSHVDHTLGSSPLTEGSASKVASDKIRVTATTTVLAICQVGKIFIADFRDGHFHHPNFILKETGGDRDV